MYGYIYKAVRKSDNKIYIGQHKGEFNPKYHGSGKLVRNDNDFEVELIEYTLNEEDSRNKERYYIERFDSRNPEIGLNIKRGGGGGSTRTLSLEERISISERMKVNNPSKKRDMSGVNNPHYGHHRKTKKKLSEETRRKMSEAAKNRKKLK